MGVIILTKLQSEIPITLREACVTLSMGASELQSCEMNDEYWFRKDNKFLKRIES